MLLLTCTRNEYIIQCFKVSGQRLWAHKAILCVRAPYFAALFHSGMREASQRTIVVRSEVESPIYAALLTYLYSDKVCCQLEKEPTM